jgi:hypothetical protein
MYQTHINRGDLIGRVQENTNQGNVDASKEGAFKLCQGRTDDNKEKINDRCDEDDDCASANVTVSHLNAYEQSI